MQLYMSIVTVRNRLFFICVALILACSGLPNAVAHTLRPAVASFELEKSGTLSLEVKTNVEALLAELGPEHADSDDSPKAAAYNDLRALSSQQLSEVFENVAADFVKTVLVESDVGDIELAFNQIVVPDPGDLDLSRDSVIELTGTVPVDAQYIVWRWPMQYGSSVVRLSTPGSEAPVTMWLPAGKVSDPLQITGIIERSTTFTVVTDYIVLGFTHILPLGLDHILFVLGLFLLSPQIRPLLWQVSAFTLAHTITLGLTIYGEINLPSNPVEVLIALSIVYVGVENCLSSTLKPWRIALVFLFGLLHGMGFAGVLGEIGLPEQAFLTALISFNIGVEFGQLAIISLAFLLVGLFRQKSWYRLAIVVPGSVVIAFTGLYWTWERVLG